ncbi:MAG TPA: serine/threonine-protein kinase [Piscinibacter sp.]|nr:serine/threonine-protein kinase [Piscinibacter sp.]HOY36577.1 serine/threonine-protein kinase [Piscinibacter sp.]HPG77529.1 serine/threonine-protein kinase [Piscinibacter sp.]HPM66797.1 serine/threonine-protein kinase [Piscinibacter sp.]
MNATAPPDPELLRRVNALLEAALALPTDERDEWLKTLPPEQRDLLPMLRRLLARAASAESDTFMRQPLAVGAVDLAEPEGIEDQPGDVIGPYRLVRELGAGGMATVWLAERIDGSLQRQEALKLPRSGWAIGLAQRMARERDILASLEHPRIARLYDAGVTAEGRPWLAMEHVVGAPIDLHCKELRLDIRARLKLFLQVADAVSHAHARLVVHRDLKPGNILVTPEGEVRLLDFGVAKLLADDAAPGSQITQMMGRAVTPDYASPEQVSGRPVGVATDVYSLGVVLYELLSGVRPYRLKRDTAAALEEAILMADVPVASAQAADRRVARTLRGDLDTIIAKAMRKEPAQRYRSVEAMAADIERHLAGEAVLARPDSRWYRMRKAIGRHRAAVAIALALLAGTALASWQARVASRERDQANALLARNEAVNNFYTMLFTEAVAPEHAGAVRQMLERGTQMVAPAFGAVPEHEAAILRILSEFFDEPDRGEALLARAAEITRSSGDLTLRAQIDCDRGQMQEALGRGDEAAKMLERWIDAPGTPAVAAVHCLQMRGAMAANTLDGQLALRSTQAALQRLRSAGLGGGEVEADLLGDIGYALHVSGRSGEAEPYFEDALQRYRALNRLDGLHARVMLSNWGVMELATGDVQRALQRYDELLAGHRRLMAWRAPPSWVLGNHAVALERVGRLDEALASYAETMRVSDEAGHAQGVRYGLVGMAGVLLSMGQAGEAAATLARADALAAGTNPREPANIRAEWVRSRIALHAGRAADAHAMLTRSIEFLKSIESNGSYIGTARRLRTDAALALGRHDEAREDAREALAIAQLLQGGKPHSDHSGQAWLALGRAENAAGRRTEARAAFEQAVQHLQATTGASSPETVRARELFAG